MTPRKPITILQIGGSQPDVAFLQEICTLSDWNPSFAVVRDCPSAYAVVAQCSREGAQPPQLIILDLDAMGRHGHDLLAFIREQPGTAEVPVVVLTDILDAHERDRSLSLGAASHLLKPTRLDEAERLVRQLKSYLLV